MSRILTLVGYLAMWTSARDSANGFHGHLVPAGESSAGVRGDEYPEGGHIGDEVGPDAGLPFDDRILFAAQVEAVGVKTTEHHRHEDAIESALPSAKEHTLKRPTPLTQTTPELRLRDGLVFRTDSSSDDTVVMAPWPSLGEPAGELRACAERTRSDAIQRGRAMVPSMDLPAERSVLVSSVGR